MKLSRAARRAAELPRAWRLRRAQVMLDLSPELVVHVAQARCTSRTIIAMSCVCTGWRDAILRECDALWQKAAAVRFPRAAAIAAASASAKPWREIYMLQLRSEKHASTAWSHGDEELMPSDFVLSYELRLDGKVVLEDTHLLPDDGDSHNDSFCTRCLWDESGPPAWVQDVMNGRGDFANPTLSVWVSRDMKTARICEGLTNSTNGDSGEDGIVWFDQVPLLDGLAYFQPDFIGPNGQLQIWYDPEGSQGSDGQAHLLRAFQLLLTRVIC